MGRIHWVGIATPWDDFILKTRWKNFAFASSKFSSVAVFSDNRTRTENRHVEEFSSLFDMWRDFRSSTNFFLHVHSLENRHGKKLINLCSWLFLRQRSSGVCLLEFSKKKKRKVIFIPKLARGRKNVAKYHVEKITIGIASWWEFSFSYWLCCSFSLLSMPWLSCKLKLNARKELCRRSF